MKKVVIVGGGFAGLNAAKKLGNKQNIEVILIDKNNYHLFQPLLYQVSMAGLNPSDIAVPLRNILSKFKNITVYLGNMLAVDPEKNTIKTDFEEITYDYLVLACGSTYNYFGHNDWANYSLPLKHLEHAREIRRRVLLAFEEAEKTKDVDKQRKLLTFIIIGGGPTGVELAGSIGEMSKFTLSRDFKNINTKSTKIILIEATERILPTYSKKSSEIATKNLESLGVHVWTSCPVSNIFEDCIEVKDEKINSSTIIWTAGVKAVNISGLDKLNKDRAGRIFVGPELTIKEYPNIYIPGDLAHFEQNGKMLPGIAPVAMQEGIFVGKNILCKEKGKSCKGFKYLSRGQLATVGRNKAIADLWKIHLSGWFAWFNWLFIHIYYLTGFKNRAVVLIQWAWSYVTYKKGSRLILK